MTIQVIHLVQAGKLGRTECGLATTLPERPWREGLVPNSQWMGPHGEITCPECIATLTYPESAKAGSYAQ